MAKSSSRPLDADAARAVGLAQKELESGASLGLAAAYLSRGDEAAARLTLARHITENPEEHRARLYYAELLCRSGRIEESQAEFERIIVTLEQDSTSDVARLVHCHGRLMELAQEREDDYKVHLHRGIGLYWLAQGSLAKAGESPELAPEALLCKAAAELNLARASRPPEARPCWFLHSVWRSLGQNQLASASLREAKEAAPFTYLSPAEQLGLALADATSLPR